MILKKEVRNSLVKLKSDANAILAGATSLYSNINLKRFEIESLLLLTLLVDDVILDRLNNKRAEDSHILCARLIEYSLILSASNNVYIKRLVKQIEEVNL